MSKETLNPPQGNGYVLLKVSGVMTPEYHRGLFVHCEVFGLLYRPVPLP